jgi:hypothetical protein
MGLFEDLLKCLDDLCKLYEQKHSTRVEKEFHNVAHSAYYLYKTAEQ